jgi:hypothetical protein
LRGQEWCLRRMKERLRKVKEWLRSVKVALRGAERLRADVECGDLVLSVGRAASLRLLTYGNVLAFL